MNLFENLQLMNESESNEIKTFNISYERNNVYQTILVKAYNEEEAKNFFEKRKPDAKIVGVKIATKDDERPGKPIINATKESSILKDEKDIEQINENAKLKNMSTKELKRLLKELEQEYNVDSSLSHGMIDRIPGANTYSSQINSIIDELEKRGELNFNNNEYPEELPFDESSILKNEKDMEQIVESVADENSLHYETIKINNSEIYVRVTEDEDNTEVYNVYVNDDLYVQESKDEVDKVELLAFECAVNYYIDNNFSDVVDEEDETEESEELTNEASIIKDEKDMEQVVENKSFN